MVVNANLLKAKHSHLLQLIINNTRTKLNACWNQTQPRKKHLYVSDTKTSNSGSNRSCSSIKLTISMSKVNCKWICLLLSKCRLKRRQRQRKKKNNRIRGFSTSVAIAWREQITHIANENKMPKITLTGGKFKGNRKVTEIHKNNGFSAVRFVLTDDLECLNDALALTINGEIWKWNAFTVRVNGLFMVAYNHLQRNAVDCCSPPRADIALHRNQATNGKC